MEIPTYQIHAVLSSLSRRLHYRDGLQGAGGGKTAEDRRLQGVIERVSCRIIEKITAAGLHREKNGAWEHLQCNHAGGKDPLLFRYSVLDSQGRRRRRSIAIEAASLLPETGTGGNEPDAGERS